MTVERSRAPRGALLERTQAKEPRRPADVDAPPPRAGAPEPAGARAPGDGPGNVVDPFTLVPTQVAILDSLEYLGGVERLNEPRWGPLRTARDAVTDALGNAVVHLASRGTRRLGLDVAKLLEFERFFFTALRADSGEPSALLQYLAGESPAFVNFTGDPERVCPAERLLIENAQLLRDGHYPRPESEPPPELAERYHPIWHRLVERHREGVALIDFCSDADPSKQSACDLMAVRMVEDASRNRRQISRQVQVERHLRAAYLPALEKASPALHEELLRNVQRLLPSWASGDADQVLGWKISEGSAERVHEALLDQLGKGADGRVRLFPKDVVGFSDLAFGLAQKTVAGPQTCWTKLLRELPESRRLELIRTVARAAIALVDAPPEVRYLPLPGQPSAKGTPVHDRCQAMQRVLLRTAMGLTARDRTQLGAEVWAELSRSRADVMTLEETLRGADPFWPPTPLPWSEDPRAFGEIARPLQMGLTLRRKRVKELLERPNLPDGLRSVAQRYLDHMKLLHGVSRLTSRVDVRLSFGEHVPSAIGVGEYYGGFTRTGKTLRTRELREPPGVTAAPRLLGSAEAARAGRSLKASVVLEGGGGKGFAYPAVLGQMEAALEGMKDLAVEVDEYVGTSAGAITASLLAAGYGPAELEEVMAKLDFSSFYADFVALMGGGDPRVGGVRRTGVFSTRKMYETMHLLLSRKLDVQGRPVLFRDLPANLKIVATVVADDLPQGLRDGLGITPEGKLVFSKETTPDFDVVAALTASASVPGFFNAPTLSVWVPTRDGPGESPRLEEHLLQLVDGGVLNNLPAAEATREDGRAALLMLPVLFEGAEPAPGSVASGLPVTRTGSGAAPYSEDWLGADAPPAPEGPEQVTLTTLDFAPDGMEMEEVDARNAAQLAPVAAALPALLGEVQRSGYERAVLALNLTTPEQQPLPILQGVDAARTGELQRLAAGVGLRCMEPDAAQEAVRENFSQPSVGSRVGQHLFTRVIGSHTAGQQIFDDSLFGTPEYKPPPVQLTDLWEMLRSVLSAKFVSQHVGSYLFEQE